MIHCKFCAIEIDTDRDYREQVGFTRKRQGGGANQITFPQDTGSWACRDCIDLAKAGIHPNQMSLL